MHRGGTPNASWRSQRMRLGVLIECSLLSSHRYALVLVTSFCTRASCLMMCLIVLPDAHPPALCPCVLFENSLKKTRGVLRASCAHRTTRTSVVLFSSQQLLPVGLSAYQTSLLSFSTMMLTSVDSLILPFDFPSPPLLGFYRCQRG